MLSTMKRWHVLVLVLVAAAASMLVPSVAFALPLLGLTGETTEITDAESALKILADGTLIRNVVAESETMDLFEQDTNVRTDPTTGGRYIERAQQFRLGGGYGARKDGGYIPIPGVGEVKNSRVDLKKGVGTVEMSGDLMRRAKGNPGAYVDWAAQELPNLVERMKNSDDRAMIGFGAGVKARVSAIAGLVITLKDGHGILGFTNSWLNFLEGDQIIAATSLAATTVRGTGAARVMTVTKVDQDNNSITVDQVATGLLADDYLFEGDAAGASTVDADGDDTEFMGLLGLIDGGASPILATFQGIPRATYTQWNSVVIDGSVAYAGTGTGGQLNEDVIQYAYEETGVRGGGSPDVLLASLSGQRSFWKTLRTQRYLVDPARNKGYVGGGVKNGKGIPFLLGDRELTVRSSRKMPPQLMFGIQTDTITRHQLDEWEWDNTTGAIWKQVTDAVGRKDAFFAYGYSYKQFSNTQPRKSFKITGLTATT